MFYPNIFEQNRLFVTAFGMTYIAVLKVIHLSIYHLIPQTCNNRLGFVFFGHLHAAETSCKHKQKHIITF